MKGIKHVLSFSIGAVYTSLWWAYMTSTSRVNLGLEVMLMISTVMLSAFCLVWLVCNWE